MRRIDLAIEGLLTTDGRYIERGALTLPDEPIPVSSPTSRLLGRATDFRREWRGRITWVSAVVDVDEGFPSLDVTEVLFSENPDTFTVKDGRIAGVTILSTDGWPWPTARREHPDEG